MVLPATCGPTVSRFIEHCCHACQVTCPRQLWLHEAGLQDNSSLSQITSKHLLYARGECAVRVLGVVCVPVSSSVVSSTRTSFERKQLPDIGAANSLICATARGTGYVSGSEKRDND
jgi:hypothetical protein